MEARVPTTALLGAAKIAAGVTLSKQVGLDHLSHVLVSAGDDGMRLSATDLEVGIRIVALGAEVVKAGSIALPAKRLVEIAGSLPDDSEIRISASDGRATIRCGTARFQLQGLAATDFPDGALPPASIDGQPVSGKAFREAISRVAFAVADDLTRPVLCGVKFERLDGGGAELVATDGHRLAMAVLSADAPLQWNGIVPTKAVGIAEKILVSGEDAVVQIAERFLLSTPDVQLSSVLVAGSFPNWRAILPTSHKTVAVAPRQALIEAVRRVALMAEEKTRPVTVSMGDGTINLKASGEDGGADESLQAASVSGPEVTFGINSGYLIDALRAAPTADVAIFVKDPLSPVVLRPSPDDGTWLSVVMPMRLR